MTIQISTEVNRDYRSVFQGFDEKLFLQLAPPFPPLRLLRYDGCRVGDEVHLEIGPGPLRKRWEALIVEAGADEEEIYFVDIGKKLPFPLRRWRHRHRLIRLGEGRTQIVDDIEYRCRWRSADYLLYPFLYWQFRIRRPVYRKVFGRP
ncbi:MAG: cyclase [Saprospiraceae bacterium]|nr:cyclase [Saprospiraceae bacterium]MCB0679173.1 cyclase [Saprospiraceae bacterium]